MKDGKIIVTGSSGLIGKELVQNSLKDEQLILVDQDPPAQSMDNFYQVDLGVPAEIHRFWKEIEADHQNIKAIIHLAAYYDFENNPNKKYAALQDGLSELLALFEKDCPQSSVFIFASSMAAISPTEPGVKQTANQSKLGAWQYPRSKIKNEAILDNFKTDKRIIQLVLAGVYTDYCELVPLFNFIELVRGKSIEKFFYPGPKARGLTYVHLSDVGTAFKQAVVQNDQQKLTTQRLRLLIGEEAPFTYQQIHEKTANTFFGKTLPIIRIPKLFAAVGLVFVRLYKKLISQRHFIKHWMIPFTGEHFEFDISETKQAIQWQPKKRIQDKIDLILQNAKENPVKWYELNRMRPW